MDNSFAKIYPELVSEWLEKNLPVTADMVTYGSMLVVAIAGGVGCSLACFVNEKLSKDRTYVNAIMSDDLEEMKNLRDFLAKHHITNVAADSYTLNWNDKTITITAYAETKAESRLINEFIDNSSVKFKRVIQQS